ncbi:uncharacterized protein JCM6883_001755 [Sporobolomyces salmoneus]|uniref:uncharacterized protein n=1 Tax=Sporobolomyces salmoneus TaxID=183962 RepID=UPI00317EB626
MKVTTRTLSQGLTRPRTHLFDVESPVPPFRQPRLPPRSENEAANDLTDLNPHLRVLKGSLRRCLFTQKVLPVDMMIPLKQLSIPPTSPSFASKGPSGSMILLPKGIQHPRFEDKVGGKGGWVMCHYQALAQLALKADLVRTDTRHSGSYKRLNSQLTMPKNLQNLQDWTLYQLLKRVEQETELFCERAKSWPKLNSLSSGGFSPLRTVKTVEEALEASELGQVEMVLYLSETKQDSGDVEEKVAEWRKIKRGVGSEKEIPVWRLGDILRFVPTPPSSTTSATSRSTASLDQEKATLQSPETSAPTGQNSILDSIKSRLDSTISLFERRGARDALKQTTLTSASATGYPSLSPSSSSSTPKPESVSPERGDIYVFSSPPKRLEQAKTLQEVEKKDLETITRMRRDLVDLWISCWRIGLWKGQGWE